MFKVVVIEDESIVRRGIVQSINWDSVDCMVMGEAENGVKGIELIKRVQPDIVISDISMPELNGIDMIEALKRENITPKVIFLTAYDDFSYARDALRLQVSDYILKPFKDGEMEAAIMKIIEKIGGALDAREDHFGAELALKRGDKSKYLSDAIRFIDENYSNPDLSVDMVAESIGVSAGYLSRLFRKETDYTMVTYLVNRRIRAAKDMLKDYSHKVYEVAELVGYRDIAYFSATFKKCVGVSPSEYQDRYRK